MQKIDRFRMRMEKPKEIYAEELKRYAEKYDFLGDFTIVEECDIDTVDYIYYFNNLNGTDNETLYSARYDIYNHMIKFCEDNGIDEFSANAFIFFRS